MKRFKPKKKKLSLAIALFLIMFMGCAYSYFNDTLIIDNLLLFHSLKYEVGISRIIDGRGTIKSKTSVSQEGNEINILCDLGSSTTQESCIVKATIKNDSVNHIGFSKEPIITYDDTYIHTITVKWKNHPTFLNSTVHENGFIESDETEEIIITVKTKNLDKNNPPASDTQIPVTVKFDFIEYPEETLPKTKDLAILPAKGCKIVGDPIEPEIYGEFKYECSNNDRMVESVFAGPFIKTLTFQRGTEIPKEATENKSIYIYYTSEDIVVYSLDREDYIDEVNPFKDLYILSKKQLYANEDMSLYFLNMINLEKINGLELLDTSMTTNMDGMFFGIGTEVTENISFDFSSLDTSNVENMKLMFAGAGVKSKNVNINISSLDTSKVTDMSYMFIYVGSGIEETSNISEQNNLTEVNNLTKFNNVTKAIEFNNKLTNITKNEDVTESTELILDVSNFDTSNVTNMKGMFFYTSALKSDFELNVSNFDTSNVTDMSGMFAGAGGGASKFELNVSNFDTSSVTRMIAMFAGAGYNSTVFTLDLSNFDTSNVTDMSYMFDQTGYSNPTFTLDVSNFDTSSVTNMNSMFHQTGYNSEVFTLDLSNFDTSNVTDMSYMFHQTGSSSPTFTLDLSNFDTGKVTDMSYMFYETGYNSTAFTLDVSNFDTSSVTNMNSMFAYAGYNSTVFTLDLSNFDTSNVTDMSYMFDQTGFNGTAFTLDVSNFDTSSVTDMSHMFDSTGYNSTVFTLDVSGFDTSNVTDMNSMFAYAGYNSTKLNTTITIRNPNVSYYSMFDGVATKEGSQIIVKYTSNMESIIDDIINTKSPDSNVIKGNSVVLHPDLNTEPA